MSPTPRALRPGLIASALVFASSAFAHDVYVLNDDHTDYGWNDTTDRYDQAMLDELDHALAEIDATSSNPTAEQSRFNADCWWYLWLYEHNRTPQQFQQLVSAIQSDHIGVPLNPFVVLYGAMPTEAAIRAGYYPGRLERAYHLSFRIGQDMENHTMPWGLSSLWAGSGVQFAWKGVRGSLTDAPYQDHTTDLFHWEGPDGKQILVKWYEFSGNNRSFGGYAEARDNVSAGGIAATIARDQGRGLPVSGLFGAGWDDVKWTIGDEALVPLAQSWNASHPNDRVILSNGVDYFEAVKQSGAQLPTLRGGWGNDWDLWPAALAERTAQTRRAVEQLRTAEAMAAVVHAADPGVWPTRQTDLASAWTDYFKYFEHTWSAAGPVPPSSVIEHKQHWAQSFAASVSTTDALAEAAFARLFSTPGDELRVAVFNPLGHPRTDVARLVTPSPGPFVVTDLETGDEMPSQMIGGANATVLEFTARDVPSLGYRIYRITPGTPAGLSPAATLSGTTFESATYRLLIGSRGQISGLVHKPSGANVGGQGLNDFGSGTASSPAIEARGPVSVTVRVDVSGTPSRRVHLTLYSEIDRVEIDDEILGAVGGEATYRFTPDSSFAQIRFEELGAIAAPGSAAQGGNFLPGARADYVTLNHFLDFASANAHLVLSSSDAFLARINQSTPSAFDLSGNTVRVLAAGNPAKSDIDDQGGDAYFRTRFALRVEASAFSGAAAMRAALDHQNPLRAILLPPNQTGPLHASVASFASISPANVELLAFKPAEDPGQGIVARLWELDGVPTTASIELAPFSPLSANATSLIETDTGALPLAGSRVELALAGHEIRALRFVPGRLQTSDGDIGKTDAGLTVGDASVTVNDKPDAGLVPSDAGLAGNVQPPCGCQSTPAALVPLLVLALCAARRRRRVSRSRSPRASSPRAVSALRGTGGFLRGA